MRLAKKMEAELLGLFIEDVDLLRLAALPLAAEVGHASIQRRALDRARLERTLQAQAASLRQALAAALDPDIAWSFRIARASPVQAVAAALAEGYAPLLLIPPGADLTAAHGLARRPDLDDEALSALLAMTRPVLILPE
jgi:hypothetical protein